jgi:hypothetical protein
LRPEQAKNLARAVLRGEVAAGRMVRRALRDKPAEALTRS